MPGGWVCAPYPIPTTDALRVLYSEYVLEIQAEDFFLPAGGNGGTSPSTCWVSIQQVFSCLNVPESTIAECCTDSTVGRVLVPVVDRSQPARYPISSAIAGGRISQTNESPYVSRQHPPVLAVSSVTSVTHWRRMRQS